MAETWKCVASLGKRDQIYGHHWTQSQMSRSGPDCEGLSVPGSLEGFHFIW